MNNSLPQHILRAELFAGLPPEWPDDPFPAIQAAVHASGVKVVVLDDDPTGTQTVHGVPVLTEWPVEALRSELANDLPACYLLTNSRSLMLAEARALNAAIGRVLVEAARQAGRAFVVVSRSDSTLRGHFPGEVEALAAALGQDFDAWLIVPFFQAGGRYTIDDVHYVADGDRLVPAGETEFARDAVFGYRASNLREWVAEKTGGRIPAPNVASIGLDDIRRGGPDRVAERLGSLARGAICVVNAASARDLDVFTRGLLAAEARGKRYLYRTASSFAAVRAGIALRPPLVRAELRLPEGGGGLVIVGSYVP
ncbi:MAG TPA: four-carbon acid sugar kinase family protein, partial [Roseiflexaceae bacterium]